VGHGEFHLRAKGGLSLFKWQGTKTKMDPVIDKMFREMPATPPRPAETVP